MRYPIRFDSWFEVLSRSVSLKPSQSWLDVGPDEIAVRMGWGFRASFPRASVAGTESLDDARPLSRGVHGWRGRWLVNGSADGLVSVRIEPPARGYVMGFPVLLKELMVSVDEPARLIAELAGRKWFPPPHRRC